MALLLRLAACATDYGVDALPPAAVGDPSIRLDPADVLDAGSVATGQTGTATFDIHNDGDALLEVTGLRLDGSGDFTLATSAPLQIPPDGVATATLQFTPTGNQAWTDVVVESNDPSAPTLVLPAQGEGLFPSLGLSPDPLDFAYVGVGCAFTRTVDLVSTGGAPVTVDGALVTGTGFSLAAAFEGPITLAPGERWPLEVTFAPSADGEAEATLYVTSDEPAQVRQSQLEGGSATEAPEEYLESWRQPDGPWDAADIVIYVDQSCSMTDDQARLRSNFSMLAGNLRSSLSDYQIAVVTADDGCHNGEIITPATSNAETTFSSSVTGTAGNYTEAGFTITSNALAEAAVGGCNDGLLREDAKTLLVMLSDEPEQSPDTWSDYVTRILALAPTAAVHAVVGDFPDGCASAEAGAGYWQAAMATGGLTLSICESDWTDFILDLVENASEEPGDTFPLSWVPDPATLVVEVDGSAAAGWVWDEDQNAIVFDAYHLPPADSWVTAAYGVVTSCD